MTVAAPPWQNGTASPKGKLSTGSSIGSGYNTRSRSNGSVSTNGHATNGYSNGHATNGYTNGHADSHMTNGTECAISHSCENGSSLKTQPPQQNGSSKPTDGKDAKAAERDSRSGDAAETSFQTPKCRC